VIDLVTGATLVLTSKDIMGNPDVLSVSPNGIHRDAIIGGTILIDDGNVQVVVTDVQDEDVICRVTYGGRVVERRGVTTPGRAPDLPFLDDRAKAGLIFAAEMGADFVALSNVTEDGDIEQARELLKKHGPEPYIISKIERAEALENFDSLLDASDAIMVARGDMGVEVPLELVPVYQKRLIARCNEMGKPVITATQMLESMIEHPRPTRAEVSDVANAILDGSDAVMLSEETAVGTYPLESLSAIVRIGSEIERSGFLERGPRYLTSPGLRTRGGATPREHAIAAATVGSAQQIGAPAIIVITRSGFSARLVSSYRPSVPVFAVTTEAATYRQLAAVWGVRPVLAEDVDVTYEALSELGRNVVRDSGVGETGASIAITAGVPFHESGSTNTMRLDRL